MTQPSKKMQRPDPSTCQHVRLQIVEVFDHPTPVRCMKCHVPFSLIEALKHTNALNEKLHTNKDTPAPAAIELHYVVAYHLDGDTGAISYVMPDLGIGTGGANSFQANDALHSMLHGKLQQFADKRQFPPRSHGFVELKELHPSYADWAWSAIAVSVGEYLEPVVDTEQLYADVTPP